VCVCVSIMICITFVFLHKIIVRNGILEVYAILRLKSARMLDSCVWFATEVFQFAQGILTKGIAQGILTKGISIKGISTRGFDKGNILVRTLFQL